jgi:hypothetical protein
VHNGLVELLGQRNHVDVSTRVGGLVAQRNASLAATQTLGLRVPPGRRAQVIR